MQTQNNALQIIRTRAQQNTANAQRIAALQQQNIVFDDELEAYINYNAVNAYAQFELVDDNFDAIITQFATQHNIQYTHIVDDYDVVVVYMQHDKAVAWLDCENEFGYVDSLVV